VTACEIDDQDGQYGYKSVTHLVFSAMGVRLPGRRGSSVYPR
jgi:hypothetical protein